MGKDRRPPSSRSPFEGIGRPSRESAFVDPRFVEGAATNATTRQDERWFGKSAKEVVLEMDKASRDALFYPFSGEFTVSVGGADIGIAHASIVSPSLRGGSAGRDTRREQLEAEERRLRPSVEKWLLKSSPGVAWDDVVGNDTARQHLVEAIEDPVRHADLFRHYGKKPTAGVLLYGPPGCGKTMFGKAAASVLARLHGARTASLLSLKGPEIQSPYVGVTEDRIRSVFAYARAYKALHGHPLVIFIDEADAILPSRDGAGGRQIYGYEESQVATFLTEMDGLEASGALVILATNRPEAIDAAILRDGRCDRKIRVERPTRVAAATILQRALIGVPLASVTLSAFGEPPLGKMSATHEPYRPTIEEHVRGELALTVADAVFAPEQVVAALATDAGPRFVRLSDIVNGAMLVGIVEQAKGNAFRRDLAAGGAPTGLTREDLEQAVISVVSQNRGLNLGAVIQEVAARDGFTAARVLARSASPLRYTVDAEDNVVRLQ